MMRLLLVGLAVVSAAGAEIETVVHPEEEFDHTRSVTAVPGCLGPDGA
jgi:hypothetical protein